MSLSYTVFADDLLTEDVYEDEEVIYDEPAVGEEVFEEDTDSVTLGGMAEVEELNYPIAIKRISKRLGKKIFTGVKPVDKVTAGTVIGSVPASFRTEVFLPAGLGIELEVKAGNRVTTITKIACTYPASLEKIRQSKFNETICKEIKES